MTGNELLLSITRRVVSAEAKVDTLKSDMQQAQAELAKVQREFELAVAELKGSHTESAPEVSEDSAIWKRIMAAIKQSPKTTLEVIQALGQQVNEASIRSTLSRLKNDGNISRSNDGKWHFELDA
jgi:multidrug resistance efflux pump